MKDTEKDVPALPMPLAIPSEFLKRAEKFSRMAGPLQVTDSGSLARADEVFTQLRQLERDAEDRRKAITGPFLDAKRKLDASVKQFVESVKGSREDLGTRVIAYQRAEEKREREERAEADRVQREHEEAQRKREESLEEALAVVESVAEGKIPENIAEVEDLIAEEPPVLTPVPHVEEAQRSQSTTTRTTRKVVIDDPHLVPRRFCAPDRKLIEKEMLKANRPVEGCRIIEETSIVSKRQR